MQCFHCIAWICLMCSVFTLYPECAIYALPSFYILNVPYMQCLHCIAWIRLMRIFFILYSECAIYAVSSLYSLNMPYMQCLHFISWMCHIVSSSDSLIMTYIMSSFSDIEEYGLLESSTSTIDCTPFSGFFLLHRRLSVNSFLYLPTFLLPVELYS